jgi:cytochrome c553
MKRPSALATAITFTLATTALAAGATERGQLGGSELFAYHGCANCHGADGKSPKSKLVPKLAGKPADKLFEKAQKILKGEDLSDEALLMHSAVGYSQSCDSPPTDPELKSITAWLATQ